MSYVAIEGLIGAGKSTVSKYIADKCNWMLLEEPVEANPVLPLFYKDPKRYAFSMQIFMLHWRYRQQQVAGHSHIPCVLDRSLPGDRVFAKLLTKYGSMNSVEWDVYEQCYNSMSMVRPPFMIVYLEVDPKTAYERIRKRNRSIESGITLEYLQDLDREYKILMETIESGKHAWSRGISLITFPWEGDYTDLENSPVNELVSKIQSYINPV